MKKLFTIKPRMIDNNSISINRSGGASVREKEREKRDEGREVVTRRARGKGRGGRERG